LIRELVHDDKRLLETDAGVFVAGSRDEMEEDYDRIQKMDHPSANERGKLSYLAACLEKSREDKKKLGANVVGEVDQIFQKALEEELKKQGRKPNPVNVITWILALISTGVGMGNLLGGL